MDAGRRHARRQRRCEAGHLDALTMAAAAVTPDDRRYMARALELARRGEGHVEPNPMVGCVVVRDGAVVGEGWHTRFGGPHAEVEALTAAGDAARGATAYVTLEPCGHTGKTPPCTLALVRAGVARVVAAHRDPNPQVDGRGLAQLAAAGVEVAVGVLEDQAADLLAPFLKLVAQRRPWVIAKWAMTLDGKLAAHTGDSRWISGEQSRARVHALRGRVDAIIVGRGTVEADDPRLTARPPGKRTAVRIVLDSQARLSLDSQLLRTLDEGPVAVVVSVDAPAERVQRICAKGAEIWTVTAADRVPRLGELLDELGRRQMTNVLVEGGAAVFGALFDARVVDEVHAFIAPRIVGGAALSPVAGLGRPTLSEAFQLHQRHVEQLGDDVYIQGRLK
jgi:diaminohydroxyphosphoribosylaminopyrimidine deaminase/5-amino-6-(5-phosphoribosylamino)uracil reductase